MSLHMKPIDGIRAITHLSLIALHTSMITTAHLPSSGILWNTIRSNPIYTIFQAGAIQVDIMFMMSSFLLVYGLINSKNIPSTILYTFRRMMRMLPSMSVVLLIGYLLGDCWELPFRAIDNSANIQSRVLIILLFINNYFDQSTHGNFTGSLLWSCAADFQMSVIIFIIVTFIRYRTLNSSSSSSSTTTTTITTTTNDVDKKRVLLAQRLKYVFIILIIISLVIRGLLFEKETRNLVKLGQFSHMGLLMTDGSYEWLKVFYGHVWQTTNAAKEISREYMLALYMPTHSRFGPFAVGGLLACNVYTAIADTSIQSKNQKKFLDYVSDGLSFIFRWLFTIISFILLAIPCTAPPPIEENPIEAQFITTVALRTLSATSVAYLLYRAVLPESHPSSWPTLAYLLSFSPFHFISNISFCSYLLHFRILMELIWNPKIRSITGLTLPSVIITTETPLEYLVNQWIRYIVFNFILGMLISIVLSTIFYYFFEKPVTKFIKTFVDKYTEKEKKQK